VQSLHAPPSDELASQALRYSGAPVRRVEDRRLVTGAARFGADIAKPGQLHAAFVRSTLAHALVRGVDTTAAASAPGVRAVLVAADLLATVTPFSVRSLPTFPSLTYTALAQDRVRYVGDPVVLVIAESEADAADAAELVAVEYEALAAVGSWREALEPAAPAIWGDASGNQLWEIDEHFGAPVEGAAGGATEIVTVRIDGNRVANAPLECRTVLVDTDPNGTSLEIWTGTQNPNGLRAGLAGLFGLAVSRIRVRTPDIGGSFGQKAWVRSEDVAVAAAALALRRPVRWVESRSENLMVGGHARDDHMVIEASVGPDGIVHAASLDLVVDQGAYPVFGSVRDGTCRIIRTLVPGPYRIGYLHVRARLVATNKASYVTYRGPWAAETLARERLMDTVARHLGIEPLELRRRNLVDPLGPSPAMVTGPTLDGLTLGVACDVAERHLDLPAFRAAQHAGRGLGRYRGVGFSMVLEPAPGPPNFFPSVGGFVAPPEPAKVRLEIDGSVSVFIAQVPSGQGHETAFAQVAADALGVDLDAVTVVHGDTDTTPFTLYGTGGSRAAFRAGGAVATAAAELRRRIVTVAGALLEANPDDLEVRDGAVFVRGTPARSLPLASVAMAGWHGAALLTDVPERLEATSSFAAPGPGWSQALHAAVVNVDVETGLVAVERYLVVADCGRMLNPAIVEGQVQGGVCQGIASVLHETFRYDAEGQPLTSNLAEYRVPSAVEVVRVEVVHLEPAMPDAPPRGVGEGGAIGAPAAIINAVEDALAPFGFVASGAHIAPEDIVRHVKEMGGHGTAL
jgi:aerobic carbon-monoxide dehydrogenase large subunit